MKSCCSKVFCPEARGGLGPVNPRTIQDAEIKPDEVYLSSCLANAKPGCPYSSAEEMAGIIEKKFGIKVVVGTHNYH